MTAPTLIAVLAVLVFAPALVRIFAGTAYTCPVCGTRRQDGHANDCPWKR